MHTVINAPKVEMPVIIVPYEPISIATMPIRFIFKLIGIAFILLGIILTLTIAGMFIAGPLLVLGCFIFYLTLPGVNVECPYCESATNVRIKRGKTKIISCHKCKNVYHVEFEDKN